MLKQLDDFLIHFAYVLNKHLLFPEKKYSIFFHFHHSDSNISISNLFLFFVIWLSMPHHNEQSKIKTVQQKHINIRLNFK